MKKSSLLLGISIFLLTGLMLPHKMIMPVKGAHKNSYNQASFWYYPWGKSGVHKGVDIFANKGTPVVSATKGLVLFSGEFGIGGNVVLILGPKWRLHYYAHLDTFLCKPLNYLNQGELLGKLGDSGNAKGKPPHLHYTQLSLIPYVWLADNAQQGWKKMFILDPIPQLNQACQD